MKPDEFLYHYTNAEALLGILGSPGARPEIWLTQIQYMNDHKEWWHAFDLFSETIRRMRTDCRSELQSLAEYMLPKEQDRDRENGRSWAAFQRSFVFSVSEEGDLLSQWRGYAPNGGYSIGFRFGDVQALAQANGFQLLKCIYEEAEKLRLIDALLTSLHEDILGKFVSPVVMSGEHPSEMKPIISAHVKIQQEFVKFATYFKHDSFREEKEWRLVGVVPAGGTDLRERWRARQDQILPYCALHLSQISADSFPVRHVITGPGLDHKLADHSVGFLRFGRPGKINVTPSKSTLRR